MNSGIHESFVAEYQTIINLRKLNVDLNRRGSVNFINNTLKESKMAIMLGTMYTVYVLLSSITKNLIYTPMEVLTNTASPAFANPSNITFPFQLSRPKDLNYMQLNLSLNCSKIVDGCQGTASFPGISTLYGHYAGQTLDGQIITTYDFSSQNYFTSMDGYQLSSSLQYWLIGKTFKVKGTNSAIIYNKNGTPM